MNDLNSSRRHFLKGLGLVSGAFATGAFVTSITVTKAEENMSGWSSSFVPSSSSSSSSSSGRRCHGATIVGVGEKKVTSSDDKWAARITSITTWYSNNEPTVVTYNNPYAPAYLVTIKNEIRLFSSEEDAKKAIKKEEESLTEKTMYL